MLEEFKKFALRGNAVDLAIGVIIGAAFGAIVNSLVGDILSPIIGAVTGGFDFTNYFIPLSSRTTADSLAEAKKQGAVLAWGNFLTVLINFALFPLRFKKVEGAEGERLDPAKIVAEVNNLGHRARLVGNADLIVDAIAPELRSGDVVAILSNGGFGGIHLKLVDALRRARSA